MCQEFYPSEPLGLCYEPFAVLTVPRDSHPNLKTFENSIFIQKQTLVKLLG